MKRKGFIKKALVYTVIGATIAGNTMPALAYTNSIEAVETDTVSESKSSECEVYAELGTNFKVIIPKKITLDGSTKKGGYTVDVEGDIAGTDIVKVVPDASVVLKSKNLANVTASISQDKTEWSYSEILAGSKVTGNGAIDAAGISAGAWNGTFNFNVALESSETISEAAGLYAADGVMLCTWEESGIDVATNYTSSTYKTSTTSGYYVLTNNYPTATKVVIPDSVTSIGDRAFYECRNLTNIEIPSSVTSIGNYAFSNCQKLTSVTIPSSVTSIGSWVFNTCLSLTSIEIPSSVTSIGNYAFSYCQKLTSVTIPSSVTSIGERAFFNCTSLTSIEIPDSVTSIGSEAFSECSRLTSIDVDENNTNYCSADGVLFDKDMTTLICYPAGKTETNYTIPSSVTSMGKSAFGSCQKLTSVTIPSSVTSIEDGAFYNCTSLTSVTIGNGVTSIGRCGFERCTSLTNITIPESITSISFYAFRFCSNLTSVTFETTSDWYVGDLAGAKTTALSSSDLANISTAATYLKTTYYNKCWTR